MQLNDPTLAKYDVRLALSRAIDRETLNNVVYNGAGIPATYWLVQGIPGYQGNEPFQNIIGYDPAAAETVSWDLPPSPRAKHAGHALGVACRHADAEAVLDVWEGTGLNVVVLDSRLHAIVRACRPLVAAAGITAIFDVEWDRAVLILMQQGTVIYRWMMPDAAIQPLAQLLTDSLSLEEEMAGWLVAEVGLVPPDSAEASLYSCVEALIKGRLDATAHGMRSPSLYGVPSHS
jgi:hypothetical protein